jgi:hypothetical protein
MEINRTLSPRIVKMQNHKHRYTEEARLGLTFNKFTFGPKFFCVVEADPMLFLVFFAFIGIKLEIHCNLDSLSQA